MQTSSSSAAERNWSTYDFIHSKTRNRLTEKRATDLVYAHSNLRIMHTVTSVAYTEATVEWEQWAVEESDPESDSNE